MTLPTLVTNMQGNLHAIDGVALVYDAMTNTYDSTVANHPRIVAGTGVPTFSAPKATMFLRKDGSSTSTRIYVNTDGGTTWTNVTTAA